MDDTPIKLGNQLNLAVSIVVLSIGLVHFFRAPLLREKRFLKGTLGFWLGQWATFTLSWLRIMSVGTDTGDFLILGLGDLQSLLAVGFSVSFLFGEDSKRRWWPIIKSLVLVYGFLLLINGVASYGTLIGNSQEASFQKLFLAQWASTGQVMSLIAICGMGLVFVLRYGSHGLFMLATCIFYATLQTPIYNALFSSAAEPFYVRSMLAFGKALLGSVFYWIFFEPAISYARINIPLKEGPAFDWRAMLRRGGVLFALAVAVGSITVILSRPVPGITGVRSLLGRMLFTPSVIITILVFIYRTLSPKLTSVRFTVEDVKDLGPDERIYLTGSCRELGDWGPSRPGAVEMESLRDHTWTTEVELPHHGEVEYKCVRIDWEHGQNHKVIAKENKQVTFAWKRRQYPSS